MKSNPKSVILSLELPCETGTIRLDVDVSPPLTAVRLLHAYQRILEKLELEISTRTRSGQMALRPAPEGPLGDHHVRNEGALSLG